MAVKNDGLCMTYTINRLSETAKTFRRLGEAYECASGDEAQSPSFKRQLFLVADILEDCTLMQLQADKPSKGIARDMASRALVAGIVIKDVNILKDKTGRSEVVILARTLGKGCVAERKIRKIVWGSWRDYKALTKEQYRILEKCTSVMKDKLNHYGRSNEKFGLIHADLHFYNVINNNGVNQIIDFDDSGYGFYMYDMGCALVTYSRNLTKLEGAWVRGYEKVRKLSDEDKKFIPMFVLLRRITRLAWLATHSDSDTAKTVDDEYLDVTIDMAKEWLKANTRVAVITGAAGGIGYGIAKKFLESCK